MKGVLLRADCFDVFPQIETGSIDMVLSDLPYEITAAHWDTSLPLPRLFQEYRRVIKDNGAIVLFGSGMFTADLMIVGSDMWKYNLVWEKSTVTGFLNAKRQPLRSHEDILVFYKRQSVYNPQMWIGSPNHNRNTNTGRKNSCYGKTSDNYVQRLDGVKYPRSILHFDTVPPSCKKHPAEKPVALLEYLIRTYTNEGDTILDNCCGVGSTIVACRNTKRKYIGIEINQEYFDIAKTRLNGDGC